ncbi:MAG: tRNA (adenosine(37)-N6)-threonylcarbamoyltransferase complex dimerization subunit type 1 TsaB [Bradyrhizobiaceae bacterium]|nr:tRNA (adenosine(37)-N6)-threonylcarbamoyltransferase complex dimerization subunit type 1 TsaB [Bradyrhizobiaceae bacterium]
MLAVDTALGACSVVLFDANLNQTIAVESVEMNRGHAEALVPMIERVMQSTGLDFDDLDRIVTTVGPGSFTGLRVGIAAARGLALASGKPAIGVSTLDALAAPFVTESETVPIVVAIDARHGNFYLQMVGAGGRKLVSPRVATLAEAIRAAAIGLVRIIGSGADLIANHWPAPELPAPLLVDARPAPDIAWVARLGARTDAEKSPPKPLYLRPPDARPQDAHRLPRR